MMCGRLVTSYKLQVTSGLAQCLKDSDLTWDVFKTQRRKVRRHREHRDMSECSNLSRREKINHFPTESGTDKCVPYGWEKGNKI